MSDIWTIYTDGGSRGNPGPAAYAYVIKRPGQPDIEEKAYLGKQTNNVAEYTGLVKALAHAKEIGGKKLVVCSDSELMVKQMNGQYRVKNPGLQPLFQEATKLRRAFESVVIKHVYRDQNSQADALCNEAMDDRAPLADAVGHDSPRALFKATEPDIKTPEPERRPAELTPLMQALDLMKQSAANWAKTGDASDPPPAEVLSRILEIVQPQR